MAEGGETTTSFENPAYDPRGDDYDDDRDETTPFLPNGASTPAPGGGEEIEMQTMQHEKNGLPERSYVETSFGGPTSERAWTTAKDLFPDMSSSELEVSYNTEGRLQVKMFGAGKKLYSLFTTERGKGLEQINTSLPKEIKSALGKSKYEKLEDEELASSQKEKKKKEMKEKRQSLNKAKKDLEDLENSEASQREKHKAKAKIRTLEAEHQKASKKYFSSVQLEAEEFQVIEEIEAEELEEEQVIDDMEIIKTIDRHNAALESRIQADMHISENPKESEECRKESKERFEKIKQLMKKIKKKKKRD